MVKILTKQEAGSIDLYLRQFDLHTHAGLSHCVLVKNGLSDKGIGQLTHHKKYRFFESNLESLCESAIRKGIKVLGITDHPQFNRYGVTFTALKSKFKKIKKKYSGKIHIANGLELDIKPDENGGVFLDYAEISDKRKGFDKIIPDVNYIVASLHYKYFDSKYFKKHMIPRDRKTYVNFIKGSISALSELREKIMSITKKNKPIIMGHPYRIIGESNYKHHDNNPHIKEVYSSKREYLKSDDCLIKQLDSDDLHSIVEQLIEHNIFIETSGAAIAAGYSDIRKSEPYYTTLLSRFIAYCKEKKIIPQIFVNSDAHRGIDVGNLHLNTIKKNINRTVHGRYEDNLGLIEVPYKRLL